MLPVSSEGSETSDRGTSYEASLKSLRSVESRIVISKQKLQDYDTSGRSLDRTWGEGCVGSLPASVLPSQHAQERYHRAEVPPGQYLAPQRPLQQDDQRCSATRECIAKDLESPIKPSLEAHRMWSEARRTYGAIRESLRGR